LGDEQRKKKKEKKAHDSGGSRDDIDGLCSRASFPCPLLLVLAVVMDVDAFAPSVRR
jgi:hypothetical protein